MLKKIIICGSGEIGSSVGRVLAPYFDVKVTNRERLPDDSCDMLGIAFPYGPEFVDEVRKYQEWYKPEYTVVFSTVKPGTCRELNATHSYVSGRHPYLEESIREFTRFLGGPEAGQVAHFFRRAGLKVQVYDKQEATELAKISQTTIYAVMIEYIKDLKKRCDELGVSFAEVHTLPSADYNRGYAALGTPEYMIPLLQPMQTRQGGHCTIPNCSLWTTPFTELVKQLNDAYE